MATESKPVVKNPGNLDLKKAEAIVKKIIKENREWLKEMASK